MPFPLLPLSAPPHCASMNAFICECEQAVEPVHSTEMSLIVSTTSRQAMRTQASPECASEISAASPDRNVRQSTWTEGDERYPDLAVLRAAGLESSAFCVAESGKNSRMLGILKN